jgi:LysM repeat protein
MAIFFLSLGLSCSSVSDEEMENLRAENLALSQELGRLKNEAQILDKALTNVYKERDRLNDLLDELINEREAVEESENAASQGTRQPDNGQAGPGGQNSRTQANNTYRAVPGDTLSGIAKNNNTTVAALLELNPYLMNRDRNMLFANDQIILPR